MIMLIRFLGWASLACAAGLLLAMLVGLWPELTNRPGLGFILLMQGVTAGALLLASQLHQQHKPLVHKALPSSLVAYGLFVLIALRWWQGS